MTLISPNYRSTPYEYDIIPLTFLSTMTAATVRATAKLYETNTLQRGRMKEYRVKATM